MPGNCTLVRGCQQGGGGVFCSQNPRGGAQVGTAAYGTPTMVNKLQGDYEKGENFGQPEGRQCAAIVALLPLLQHRAFDRTKEGDALPFKEKRVAKGSKRQGKERVDSSPTSQGDF